MYKTLSRVTAVLTAIHGLFELLFLGRREHVSLVPNFQEPAAYDR